MDFDGTDSLKESVAMCKTLKSQGVATVCATPHFYPWNDDVDAFLERRTRTLAELRSAGVDIEIIPGAEVQLFRSLSEHRADKMCIGNSRVILLEMPHRPFEKWMIPSIENTIYKYSLIPVIAHIERYGYSKEVLAKFAAIPGVVFQITVSELKYKQSVKMLDTICSFGVPVILGTDAHNMRSRAPRFDIITEKLAEKEGLFKGHVKTAKAIIENCLYAGEEIERLIRTAKPSEVK